MVHILKSERYELLIMSVIKFCTAKESGRNMQILKETFSAAHNMFTFFSLYMYIELGG